LKLDYEPNPRLNGRPTTPAEAESWRPAAALSDRLAELHDESARQGAIAVGPHRDDWRAQMGGFDLGRFGSQGENRLAALALKLASADLLAKGLGDPPILLLDDFGSELDAARRRGVLGGLRGKMQVFITATESSALGPETLFDRIERIRDGAWVEG
jgi:DNA replication and repair protein RecF